MPTLDIEGRKVKIGDDFLKLSPDEQNATVEEIARSIGSTPQPEAVPVAAQAAAPAPAEGPPKTGLQKLREAISGPTRVLENGFLMGLGDRARAGMDAIIGNGSYGENLKREQGQTEQFNAANPIAGPIAETVGNIMTPVGVLGAAAKGATLGARSLYAAGAGAGLGGVQGFTNSKDWTNVPQTVQDTAQGTLLGAGIGGAMPGAARVIGAGYNAAANAIRGNAEGMSRGASRHLVDAMVADTPQAVQARLAQLGPDATLADAGPAFLGKAQGASLNSDEGRSVLQGALTSRNAETNQRIMGDVNRALGPAEDPQTVTNTIRGYRSEVDGRNYPAAFANSPPVNPSNVVAELGQMLPNSVGMEARALENLRGMLMVEHNGRLMPQSNPQILHKIKGELDNVIEYDAPGLGLPAAALSRQQGALRHLRGMLNETLEQQVPGYLQANRVSAGLARRGDAVELGTQYLGNGKTTASPGRFTHEFQQLEPGEQIAFAKGSRGEIERKLGTKANDLVALQSELQGEGGWNTAKLATVHGQAAADELINSVDRNRVFRDTYNKVVENSQTAQRTAAAQAMKPTPASETALINPNMTLTGLGAAGVKRALAATYGAIRPDQTRAFGEIAEALTRRGSSRDATTQAIIEALDRRRGNAAIAPAAGDRGALIAAIAAHGAARSNPRRKKDQ